MYWNGTIKANGKLDKTPINPRTGGNGRVGAKRLSVSALLREAGKAPRLEYLSLEGGALLQELDR